MVSNLNNYFVVLKKSPFFTGIEEAEMNTMIQCLNADIKKYRKDEFIFRQGDYVRSLGMVLKGRVHIVQEDFWGNRNILTQIDPGQIFAETYACLNKKELRVDVIAEEEAEILFLDMQKVIGVCGSACRFHTILIRNLLDVLAGKNLMLTTKIGHVMQRSTREKILSYLSEQSLLAHASEFIIPFNRQELADYLSVDRSALSNELSKLSKEGLIEYKKNKFRLYEENT